MRYRITLERVTVAHETVEVSSETMSNAASIAQNYANNYPKTDRRVSIVAPFASDEKVSTDVTVVLCKAIP